MIILGLLIGLVYLEIEVYGKKTEEPILLGLVRLTGTQDEMENNELIPLLAYENGKFRSFVWELEGVENFIRPAEAQKVLQLFQTRKFWLYSKGKEVGKFQVIGSWNFTIANETCLFGKIFWKEQKPKKEQFGEIIALSQPINQPFWPKKDLTEYQRKELKRVINAAFSTAFQKFKLNPQWFVSSQPHTEVEVMDFEQDGQIEVYISDYRERKTFDIIAIHLLLRFKDNQWVGLRKGYCYGISPEFQYEGDGCFDLQPVDVDGNGVAEIILTEYAGESWSYSLYLLKEGKLVKAIADLGGGGL